MIRRVARRRRVWAWYACMAAALAPLALGMPAWSVALPIATALLLHPWMRREDGVAILTYHSVAPSSAWLPWAREIAVCPETLNRQLTMLRRGGCTLVSTRAIIDAREKGLALPDRPVALHFDDGYYDNWLHAAPILKRHAAPACFFVTTRFIEPSPRTTPEGADDGYMTAEEIRDLNDHPGFEVHPHGTDHGRVAISGRAVATLSPRNWRGHAWMIWRSGDGSLHDWHRREHPPLPYGTEVPESAPALAAPAVCETRAAFEARIRDTLATSRHCLRDICDTPADIYCWPENEVGPEGRKIAAGLGFRATTGGLCRNAPGEPPEVLSRVHMGDRALGFRWVWADGLLALATARAFHGNYYWALLLAPAAALRRLVIWADDVRPSRRGNR
jgi:peptidoglycan/xylan/chitin deacetylase (PgdA/CDA1 family)